MKAVLAIAIAGARRALVPALCLALAQPGFMTGAALAQGGIIAVPLGDSGEAVDAETIERLTAERFSPDRARGTQADMTQAGAEIISPLRPLRATGQPAGSALRFSGEANRLEFMLYLPEPGNVRALRLTSRSSINLLPERSQFRVYLNDAHIGTGQFENFVDFAALDLPIDAGALRQGGNLLRIEASQYHRIYCGPDASFALWSEIDLSRSGAVLDSLPEDGGAEGFLMGVAAAAASGAGVEIRGASGLGAQADAWIGEVTGRLSAALGGDPLPFHFSDFWTVAGESEPAARITFLPAEQQRVRFRMSGEGGQVMVVEYRPDEPPQSLPDFPALAASHVQDEQMIDLQRPVAMSELGFRTAEVASRYALVEQRFRLPDDFVLLTNAKAELRLDYIYADGLPRGSMMLVHVNGTNVRLLPLRGEGGRPIEGFPVRFEARLLRAGSNTLSFEVIIPGEPVDLPCATWDGPVLAIGEDSTLDLPYSPSMFLPDMHFAFVNLLPDSLSANELTARAFDADDLITLRGALATGARARAASSGARLHLLALDDLGSVPTGGYGFSRRSIETVLLDGGASGLAGDGAQQGASGIQRVGLLDTARPRESTAGMSAGWEWVMRAFHQASHFLHPRAGTMLEEWLAEQRGQAIMLQLDPARPNQMWLLRAPGSDVSAIASAIAAARVTGGGPRGQVAVLDHDGNWQSWFAPDRQPVLLEPLSPGNLRHVLGNFVSAMPIRYVAGLFFLALVSAVVALRLVIATRES
ncbi:MAG: cellulose biosynthesis cyclic di-GMP-binding regulatory protein BcsB [Pararhodobacter sp.]|nr:cellulose biosynthesis cyclic di-GMP-binding regulatory protein BcsB [Pararhodobacter sp.]